MQPHNTVNRANFLVSLSGHRQTKVLVDGGDPQEMIRVKALSALSMQQEFRVDSSLRSTCDGTGDRLLRMRRQDTVEY